VATTVGAESWGVVVEAPGSMLADALDRALTCALQPAAERIAVQSARASLIARLRGPDAAMRSWAANAVAPGAPGTISVLGSIDSLANVSLAELRRALAETTTGRRVTVGVVGDVPVRETVERIARRIVRLAPGEPASAASLGAPGPETIGAPWAEELPRVVVAWRDGSGGDGQALAARAFAAAVGAALGRQPGCRLRWSDGGAGRWGAWAAVAVDVAPAELATFPEATARATASVVEAAQVELDRLTEADRWEAARPGPAALRLTRDGEPPPASDARPLAARLVQSRPIFVIGRP
jgi:hypothetical protein